ncbi:MAG TPA: hypothetical protein VM100_14010 [Longimicrobiales bacterium]|nr:hypothetical protein [Longimicrobiales bacterium]
MSSSRRWLLIAFTLLVALYAAIFPVLTVDTLGRILTHASNYQPNNLLLLLFLELSRLFLSVAAIGLALALFTRDRHDARTLALLLLFSAVAYEKVFGSNGFPGPLQERMTNALLQRGATQSSLNWLFGAIAWPVWAAWAALLRFSVVFPQLLTVDVLDQSGQKDRRGFLRGSGVAGSDVGGMMRRASAWMLQHSVYSVPVLSVAAIVMIIAYSLLRWHIGISMIIAAACIAIPATNLRAAYLNADGEARSRATWVAQGPLLALFMFLCAAALLVLAPGNGPRIAAFLIAMLIPSALICCLALSVLDRGELDTHDALARTVRAGSIALAIVLVFGLVARFNVYAAVAAAVLTFPLVRRAADGVRSRIMEE